MGEKGGGKDNWWTGSSRDEWWMREKVDFGTVLYSMCMSMNGGMLPLPTHHRSKYLHHQTPEDMTHEFYKELYTNIIRDIDVSS